MLEEVADSRDVHLRNAVGKLCITLQIKNVVNNYYLGINEGLGTQIFPPSQHYPFLPQGCSLTDAHFLLSGGTEDILLLF